MVKKVKALSEKQLSLRIKESAHQIWLAGLGAFALAQEEGSKVFDNLVNEGKVIEDRTRKAANERVDSIRDRATGTFDRLEQVFEDRVSRALNRLGVPTNEDIQVLATRVAELNKNVQALLDAQKPTRTVSRKADEKLEDKSAA